MQQTKIKVGPEDHGRRMSLADFDLAEVQEGYLYELSRGIITVSDVPGPRHFAQVDVLREQFYLYRAAHPGRIYRIGSGSECKLLVGDLESERHPDVLVYKTPPPTENTWSTWVPDLVIEVVSPGSQHRDYDEKREEYLAFGVKEYWIVDADEQEILALRRWGGRWRERYLRPGDVYEPRVLPGFQLDVAAVFRAADEEDA